MVAEQKQDGGFDFEEALAELEEVVEGLEQGELSLEESLRRFERGIALTRRCQKALEEAEQQVRILMEREEGGEAAIEEFEPDDSARED
ncbi:MAG: exodeoxyribonuclease VII small subunit [Gammaproteobacteria bacterium]|nr:MAG: exodeoxyribonuclease VII small subunit [Gammaproteobacteria bacterium]